MAKKDLGKRAFSYGWPALALMLSTYNEDGSVNVMNLHECTRTNAEDLALCVGPGKKSYCNIEKRGAFTIALTTKSLVKEVDYFGLVSGYQIPNKFEKAGLTAQKSRFVDAPVINESSIVVECELKGFLRAGDFGTILGRVVNITANESVLDPSGAINAAKAGLVFYDSFSSSYFELGEKVGRAFGEGKALY